MMRYWFLSLNILLILSVSNAQKEISFEEYKSRYTDKQAIMPVKRETVKISLDKEDSLEISLQYYSEMLHLGERTEGLAENSVSYSDFIDITDLDAKTLTPAKSGYKTIKVTDFKIKSHSGGSVFFDDTKQKIFNYPGVQPGAKTLLSYSQKFKEARLLMPYYFNFYVPVIESELVLMVDKRVKIGYRVFNNKEGNIHFSESSEGNFKVYRWSGKMLPEYISESNAPDFSYHEPHVIYYIEEIHGKKRSEVLLKETKDLYNWYYSMAIKSQQSIGTELKFIVDSLTKGVQSPQEKTKKIFYWVQDQVKYVAFEEGYGGFIPRDANLVCNRRFGDCKDMANLLVQMLNQAGVKAYHVWIGTRHLPYSYKDIPSPNVDNHMIAAVKLDGTYTFLDATGRYIPLGYPTSMIQGKEALIGIDEHHYEIVKVPVMDASKSGVTDSVFCKIDNGNQLKGSGSVQVYGYNKVDLTYLVNYTKKDNLKEFMKEYCTKGSNKFSLQDYSIKNLDDKEAPVQIRYTFQLDDYIKASGNELYINLNLDRPFDKDRVDTAKRKLPVEYEQKYTQEDVIVLEIPKGYKVEYLPQNTQEHSPFFEYHISYKQEGNSKIVYHKKIVLNTLLLEKKEFSEWNKIINKLSNAYREVIVFKKG